MSIAVTIRPRRLSTPAISGAASGTRVKPVEHEDILHARDREAEQLASDRRGDVFGLGRGFEHADHVTSLTPRGSCRRSAP